MGGGGGGGGGEEGSGNQTTVDPAAVRILGPPALCAAVTEAIGDFFGCSAHNSDSIKGRHATETWREAVKEDHSKSYCSVEHRPPALGIAISCTASGRGRGKGNETAQLLTVRTLHTVYTAKFRSQTYITRRGFGTFNVPFILFCCFKLFTVLTGSLIMIIGVVDCFLYHYYSLINSIHGQLQEL